MSSKIAFLILTILALIAFFISSCNGSQMQVQETPLQDIFIPSPDSTNNPGGDGEENKNSESDLSERYRFPEKADLTQRYLFYLHGKIIEDQGLPAISPDFGEYRYKEILEELESHGFVVISEQRSKDAVAGEYARKVADQVNHLLDAGVPPGSITVAGASKGAAISTTVSNLVSNSEMNYVLLGACYQPMIEEWKQEGIALSGNVLAIYDSADEYATSCQDLFDFSNGKGLGRQAEIILHVGAGHGILYEPLLEWIQPTVNWANQEW